MPTRTNVEIQATPIVMRIPDGFDPDSEPLLIARAKAGSSDAIRQLLMRYERRVLRTAQKITTNYEDAEEVVQNAFVKAFFNLATFRGDSRFYTWLVRIIINEAFMKVRGRRHKREEVSIDEMTEEGLPMVFQELEDGGLNPEEQYCQGELQRAVATTIGDLEPGYRDVIDLREVQGFSTKETAEALALSTSAVKARLRRARIRLRKSLRIHYQGSTSIRAAARKRPRPQLCAMSSP